MLKRTAIEFFGSATHTARAVGITLQSVSSWPDVLPPRIADRVIAAAVRLRMDIPPELLETEKQAA
jgi:transcriptional repressor of cell division inhibition gene dicB